MKYHTLFLLKTRKDVAKLSSAAVVIGALRVYIGIYPAGLICIQHFQDIILTGNAILQSLKADAFDIQLCFQFSFGGAQWLSGRVLDSRPRGCGFEPHRSQCVVSFSKIY